MEISKIYDVLYRLGLKAESTSFFYVSFAVLLTLEDPQYLDFAEEFLYPEIARQYKTTVLTVTRGIQSVLNDCWENRKGVLYSVTGFNFAESPTIPIFLLSLADYLRRYE